jgi:hypothetical protein
VALASTFYEIGATSFLNQFAGLVHADNRENRIVGPHVYRQNIFRFSDYSVVKVSSSYFTVKRTHIMPGTRPAGTNFRRMLSRSDHSPKMSCRVSSQIRAFCWRSYSTHSNPHRNSGWSNHAYEAIEPFLSCPHHLNACAQYGS